MRYLFFFFILIVLSCCSNKRTTDFVDLGKSNIHFSSVEEYQKKKEIDKLEDSVLLKFMFLNNPFNLNDKNLISIYINNHLVYWGAYKKHIDLRGSPESIFANSNTIDLSIEILTDTSKNDIWVHRFFNKFGPAWLEDYQIIYCGFFPTNEHIEQMLFFPQLTPYIN
jgi:hypothetical protein